MFEVEVNTTSSKTDKLLSNIESLLIEQNELLRQALPMSNSKGQEEIKIESKANYDTLGRKELLAIIKTFPKGTIKGKYMTMELNELRKAVKEATK